MNAFEPSGELCNGHEGTGRSGNGISWIGKIKAVSTVKRQGLGLPKSGGPKRHFQQHSKVRERSLGFLSSAEIQ